MATKVGVILSGCGVYDGSEIHEAVITLLAIDRAGAEKQDRNHDLAGDMHRRLAFIHVPSPQKFPR